MKTNILMLLAVACLSFLVACGGEAPTDNNNTNTTTTDTTKTTQVDETGPEYTSAYICPMHCKGSGSDKAGSCPVCKMDYVASKDHKHDDHHGHNHDDHNHDHGDHSGHNH